MKCGIALTHHHCQIPRNNFTRIEKLIWTARILCFYFHFQLLNVVYIHVVWQDVSLLLSSSFLLFLACHLYPPTHQFFLPLTSFPPTPLPPPCASPTPSPSCSGHHHIFTSVIMCILPRPGSPSSFAWSSHHCLSLNIYLHLLSRHSSTFPSFDSLTIPAPTYYCPHSFLFRFFIFPIFVVALCPSTRAIFPILFSGFPFLFPHFPLPSFLPSSASPF